MAPDRIVNGVNIDQLFNAIDLFKEKPDLALFKFRATNKWLGGTHSRATVKDFYGPGQEDTSREARSFDLDEPPVLLGQNEGLNPVEYLFGYAKQRELANLCVQTIAEVRRYASRRLQSMQRRPNLVRAFWQQAELAL